MPKGRVVQEIDLQNQAFFVVPQDTACEGGFRGPVRKGLQRRGGLFYANLKSLLG